MTAGTILHGTHLPLRTWFIAAHLGKTDNCQIAVTLSIANHAASLPIAYRLYLPEDWAKDAARRKKVHIPDDVVFRTKPRIALDQIEAALAAGVAPGVLLADTGYGVDGAFRSGITAMGLAYVVGMQSTLSLWPLDMESLPPKPWNGRGRKPSRVRRDADHVPVCAKKLARQLPKTAWRIVSWREGSNETLSSRFAAVRVRPASRTGNFQRPIRSNRFSSNGPKAKKSQRNTGFRPCPKTRPSTFSSIRPNGVGASNATTRN